MWNRESEERLTSTQCPGMEKAQLPEVASFLWLLRLPGPAAAEPRKSIVYVVGARVHLDTVLSPESMILSSTGGFGSGRAAWVTYTGPMRACMCTQPCLCATLLIDLSGCHTSSPRKAAAASLEQAFPPCTTCCSPRLFSWTPA